MVYVLVHGKRYDITHAASVMPILTDLTKQRVDRLQMINQGIHEDLHLYTIFVLGESAAERRRIQENLEKEPRWKSCKFSANECSR